MNDLISRQAAVDEIEERKNANGYRNVAVISELNRLEGYIMRLPSAQPKTEERKEESAQNVPKEDLISRKEAIDALDCINGVEEVLRSLPSAQPTLCGYDIEHLILIAEVLRKENLPPERITEVLTDIGRIVSIVIDEFNEKLRKAVEQCEI